MNFFTSSFVLMTMTVMLTIGQPIETPKGAIIEDTYKNCTPERNARTGIRQSNQIVKGSRGIQYDGLTGEEHNMIVNTVELFLDVLNGDYNPCEKQYDICIAAARYEDSCLPLWLIEDALDAEEKTSVLFRNFRTYFFGNYAQYTCAIMYFNNEFGYCGDALTNSGLITME